jgi:CTP:molybdopterin cytidylyltransferase MocA
MTSPAREVAGVLLAAGGGSRFGGPKALVEFEGERLADRGVRLLADGGCGPVVAVLGAAPITLPGAITVTNPDWATGMGSSLRAGLRAVPASARAAVIALADQPLIRPAAVRRLIEAFEAGAEVVVAEYGGRSRNPVLISRAYFAEVSALAEGDVGARPFLRARPELVTRVACDDAGDPADVDTLEDLRRLSAVRADVDRRPPGR